jgi:5-bromo-4-chloroindolyl phosphate hydrolysis protein
MRMDIEKYQMNISVSSDQYRYPMRQEDSDISCFQKLNVGLVLGNRIYTLRLKNPKVLYC